MLLTREHQNICSAANRWRSRHLNVYGNSVAFGLVTLFGMLVCQCGMHTMHLWVLKISFC